MTLRPLGFRRVVLGLQPGMPSSATELAVELASLLDLELIGLFIDDFALRHCAAMPAARAISALGTAWNSLEFAHEPGEADYAAEIAGAASRWPPNALSAGGSRSCAERPHGR